MRKSYIIIVCAILAIIMGIIVGIKIGSNNKSSNLHEQSEIKLAEEKNKLNNENQIISTSAIPEKTTPNTLLIFKTYYNQCKHTSILKKEIPENFVNKTENELAQEYKDWKIEHFSKEEVSFQKEREGICKEHYLIKNHNGYVAIYLINETGKEILQETTEIVVSYLPQTDQLELEKGIKVIGREQLNATLEDYE